MPVVGPEALTGSRKWRWIVRPRCRRKELRGSTSIEPWNYYYKQTATPGGLEEQRRCYRAFMETWKNSPVVGGIIWWEWLNTTGGSDDFNYIPKGKPAENELRQWFQSAATTKAHSATNTKTQ